jgi:gliding motility-associated transport system ATP-binding protein
MIKVEHLVKAFGHHRAVDDVSFEISDGTILGFLGPNGAGKTTTIRILAGYLLPTSGTAVVQGCDVIRNPVEAQTHIGYMPENTPLYDDMTVESFLRFVAELRGFQGKERNSRVEQVMESCFLSSVRHQTIETLSKGYRQRTCFAQALIHDPPVLLLDEPTEGLDPNQKQVVRQMISEMGQKKIIMLCTHVLEEVEAICKRVIIISNGEIVADSTPAKLKKQSGTYNIVTVQVVAPRDQVVSALEKIGDVKGIEVLRSEDDHHTLRLTPQAKQPLAAKVVEAIRGNGWLMLDLQTDGGRLDEVFRQITITEDAGQQQGSPRFLLGKKEAD